MHPFWSPDSRFIAYFAQGKLKKMEVPEGPPQILCDVSSSFSFGGTWNRDGVIVFAPQYRGPLCRVSAAGGEPTPVTSVDRAVHEVHLWPHFLRDGQHFLYLGCYTPGAPPHSIQVGSLGGNNKKPHALLDVNSSVAYAPSGYLFFERDLKLFAQPFDADSLKLRGEAAVIAEAAINTGGMSYADVSVTETTLAYRNARAFPQSQLVWFDRQGKSFGTVGPAGPYQDPGLSPDEKQVAVSLIDPESLRGDIVLLQLSQGIPLRFTFSPSFPNGFPVWSPDGNQVVLSANRTGAFELYQKPASGTGKDELLLETRTSKEPTDWSQDGRYIVYLDLRPRTQFDLWVLPLFGDRQPKPFLQSEFNEKQGRLSPDGRWMAYASDETGRYEVYVQPFPATGGKWQISTGGGDQPSWRRDGKELFFVGEGQKLIAVGVDATSSTFRHTPPRELFRIRSGASVWTRNQYAVTADGQRFLVNTSVESSGASPITVVINWGAGLRR